MRRAQLHDWVELRHGDATEVARILPGPFDLVFFDSVQMQPWLQLEFLLPKLAADAMILADNVLSHPEKMAAFLEVIDSQPAFDHIVAPVGKGLCIAYRDGRCPVT